MPQNHKDLKIALFCGGTGTRMWPASRRDKPKQFQPLVGKESMFQQAVKRIRKGFPIKDIYVITGRNYVGLVVGQVPDLPLENIIVEPEMRDTLAAVGFAAAVLDKKFKNPTIASLWAADHLVRNEDTFVQALKAAYDYVENTGKIVSVDVRPTYPNTHIGYIQIGKMIKKIDGLSFFEYVKHIEKPDQKTAKRLVASFDYLWHAGYKVWQAQKMLALYKKHTPATYEGLMKIHKAWGTDQQDDVIKRVYPKLEKIQVDFAVFEKMDPDEIVVLPADLGWSDIGAWDILKDELSENSADNVTSGEVLDIDSEDCLIYNTSPNKVVATIGLKDLIVVDTPNGLLVCKKDRVSDVKKVVEKLKEAKKDKYL